MERSVSRNSSLALERLRIIIEHLELDGIVQLPTERELSDQIGVGRRAVRRALDVLNAEGRIWRRQGAGTFIGIEPSRPEHQLKLLPKVSNMLEVMEVRLRLETDLAQLAAVRASQSEIERMRDLADKVTEAKDMDSRELWDSSLHRSIASASGNKLFLALFEIMDRVRQDKNWRHVREVMRTEESLNLYHKQHMEVIDAIESRDPQAAGQAMKRHILSLQEQLNMQISGVMADVE